MAVQVAPQKFAAGVTVWIPDPNEVFVEGTVVGQEGDSVTVKKLVPARSKPVTVSSSECFAKDNDVVDDMTRLVYLHEAGVLHNLHSKYFENSIYTYTGSILIAVNPFQRLPELYDASMRAKYQKARIGELAPHVFAVADTAYRAMMEEKRSQSVLISGESGAGKTETTKLVMEYLAGVGGRAKTSGRSVESQVLESNPLLEAFGNAKTVRNNNSSRFGKFIEIQFNKWGRVSGAAIKSYLLERSRVVNITDPERNYHCFYQLCFGATPEEVEKFRLPSSAKRARMFHYLNQSNCYELAGVSNVEEYKQTKHAMDVMGITKQEQESIWKVVAAVLHLGNVEFVETEDHNAPVQPADVVSKDHLDSVAHLLQVNREVLENALVHRFRKISAQVVPSRLDVKGAVTMRDSLAKNLYSKLFDWIVQKVNSAIGEDESSEMSIGVLDIYGFEAFKHNSFEQFCINLANEKLQQHFNMHVLKMEQEEYEREQINWSRIPFADNQDCLDLIEKEKGSILAILDSDSKLGTKTAEGFTRTLQKEFGTNPRFSMAKTSRADFTLEHYAGKVKYNTEEFLIKNVDAVVTEHHKLLSKSGDSVVADMFPEGGAVEATNQFVSLGMSFRRQLAELMDTLNETEPHYIRCVKPNTQMKPHFFERQLVMSQLRSGGVLEAVRMCSAGYPTRRTFADFIERFWVLSRMSQDVGLGEKKLCEMLMEKTNLADYQIGLTKIFLRAGQMVALDTLLSLQKESAIRIQLHVRRYWFLKERRRASLSIQTWWRGRQGKAETAELRAQRTQAAIVFQKFVRMRRLRSHFVSLRMVTRLLQARVRARLQTDRAMATKVRQGVDRKAASKAERFARAQLESALSDIRRLEAVVDKKAQELVGLQDQLNRARQEATSCALAVEKITGAHEPILDTLMDHSDDEKDEEQRGGLEMMTLQAKMLEMQQKLVAKEQEVKALSKRLAAIPSIMKMPELPPDQQQTVLLREVASNNFGFSEAGQPVTATMIFKSLLHWKSFSAERTNTFDHIVDAFQQAARNGSQGTLCYWLSNTLTLHYLVSHVTYKGAGGAKPLQPFAFFSKHSREQSQEHVDTMLFKLQLGTSVERLFVTIRDSVKADLSNYLNGTPPSAPPPLANGSAGGGGKTPGAVPLAMRFTSSLRAQVSDNWSGMLDRLREVLDDLRRNFMPPLLVHFLMKQLLAFIDVKVFNSLMVRSAWCPCTYSNGVTMGEGLSKILTWLATEVDDWLQDWLGPELPHLSRELVHIQQAVFFLLIDDKPQRTIDDIRQLCPDLSMNQLVHICIWYDDDKHGSQGVEPAVIELMWALMVEDSPMLLRDDDSIPFSVEDIVESMDEFNIEEVEPPAELLHCGLHFLLSNTQHQETPNFWPLRSVSVR